MNEIARQACTECAEEALRDPQTLHHSLVEQLPVGVFRKDAEGRYVLVNAEFCRLYGRDASQFLGKTPLDIAGHDCRLGISVGIALGDGDSSADALLLAADRAMYQQKKSVRG